jgi:hypothetical protein
MLKFFLSLLFLFVYPVSAETDSCSPHYLSIGPEVYSLKREREGGTRQRGTLYGLRASYDYIARYKFYMGFEGSYARGTLRGKSGGGDKLRSRFTDSMLEGRFGYTLQSLSGCCGWFTPFIGGGYFWENNDYVKPSPKHLRFRNGYGYACVGCLAGSSIRPVFDIGLYAAARFSIQGKVDVSHDKEEDDTTLKYEQKVNCRIALPLTYVCGWYDIALVPFYEYRHYGRRNAFPFDFLDTRIKVYGADLFFVIKF